MKSPKPFLGRFPSVNEILENPRIKSLMERVNQMEVTSGVRQYVERARQELSRRSLDMPIPSIGEITERAARYILRRRGPQPARVINATGQYWPAGVAGPPVAEEAILAAGESMQHYHAATTRDVEEALAEAAGGKAAIVCNTASSALWLALAASHQGKGLVIARGELGTLDDGTRISELALGLGISIVEVGAADGATLEDYRQAFTMREMVVLRVESLAQRAWEGDRPSLADLAGVCQPSGGVLVHYLHNAPLQPLAGASPEGMTLAASLKQGADVAVVRGEGYLGGPSCGLAVGGRKWIAAMRAHPLAPLLKLHPSLVAALGMTLTLHRTTSGVAGGLPIVALRSTPLENLRLRAERIAAQLAALTTIAEAKAVALESGPSTSGTRELASFGVHVKFSPESIARARREMAAGRPRIDGVWLGDELLLDLRTMFPGEDIEVVSHFESHAPVRIPVEGEAATESEDEPKEPA